MKFRVLGSPELSDDEGPLEIGAAKLRELLALMLLRPNRPCRRDQLIDGLWNGAPPSTAVATLQSYVYRLRALLAARDHSPITSRPDGYQLTVPAHALDLWQYERLVSEGRAASRTGAPELAVRRLRAALGLWQGGAFSGVDLDAVRTQAELLDNDRLLVVEECLATELTLAHHGPVITELADLVSDYPLRESLWELLIRALATSGRRAEALGRYDELTRILDDELGVPPGRPIQSLRRRLIAGTHEPTAERHQLRRTCRRCADLTH